MMDNAKLIEQINRVVIDQYVRRLLVLKVNRLQLFAPFPITGAADLSESRSLLMFEDLLEIARLLGPNQGN